MAEQDEFINDDSEMDTEAASRDADIRNVDPDRPVVVGIGASAGGLSALTDLLAGVPRNPGMAFVIVQHLNPDRESSLVEILSKRTDLAVSQVEKETRIEENHVYIIPPGYYLAIEECCLKLSDPKDSRGSRMAIDYFLTSLAEDTCEFAIGIILSGTGSDGSAGLRDIKHYGGLTVVQDPEDAEHPGMPKAAIDSISVDFVLPADQIGSHLKRYVEFCKQHGPLTAQAAARKSDTDITRILDLMRRELKQDFRRYRRNTLTRRIRRRMGLMQLDDVSDYLNVLADNAEERESLGRDLLIGVTRFFRDASAWEVLEKHLQSLIEQASQRSPLRIWCAGCATGEEAYSVAMMVLEQREHRNRTAPFKIFATDVSENALAKARAGSYPESIAKDVSRQRLQRFFKHIGDTYEVSKQLRESVVFAHQNVLAQPPFARLDLILCRNLLIYFQRDAQARVLDVFQFALKENGLLFLGATESIARSGDLFQSVSKKHRLFRRTGVKSWTPSDSSFEANLQPIASRRGETSPDPRQSQQRSGLAASVQRQLLQELDRAVAVVNKDGKVLFVEGRVDLYLQLNTGELSAELPDILQVARRGIKAKLRSALREAWKSTRSLSIDGKVQREGGFQNCQIQISRLFGRPDEHPALLVIFTPTENVVDTFSIESSAMAIDHSESVATHQAIVELEHELATTREQLSSSIAELESANEELKASNEEALTMNEELQSSNEELETSKEELQSLNEELSTMNNQLEMKVGELEETTNDLQNFLTSSDVPTLFLDSEFCIRRFTAACGELLHMLPGDVGRPLSDINSRFDDSELMHDAEAVLRDLQPRERQVASIDGQRWYKRRILPYRTEDDRIQGVVMTLTDVTDLLTAQREAELQLAQNKSIYGAAPIGLAFVDADLIYVSVNQHLADINGLSIEDHYGKRIHDILPPELAESVLRMWQGILKTGEGIRELEISGKTDATESEHDYLVSYTPLKNDDGRILGINIVVQDISDRKRWEAALRNSEGRLRRVLDHQLAFVALLDANGVTIEINESALQTAGVAREDAIGVPEWEQPWWSFSEQSSNQIRQDHERTRRGEMVRRDAVVKIGDGSLLDIDYMLSPVYDEDGKLINIIASAVDISQRKQGELAVRRSERFNRAVLESTPDCIKVLDANQHIVDMNRPGLELFEVDDIEQIKGKTYEDFWPEDQRESLHEAMDVALAGGEGVHEGFCATLKGNVRFWRVTVRHVDRDGDHLVAISRDLTEQRQSQIDLQESRARLQAFLDSAPVLMGLIEIPSDFSDMLHVMDNRAAEEFLERQPGATGGKWSLADLHAPPEKIAELMPYYRECFELGQPISFIFDATKEDAETKQWFNTTVVHLGEGEEGRQRFCYVAVDDSQRAQAEEDLLRSHEVFSLLIEESPFGVYVVDQQMNFLTASSETRRVFKADGSLQGESLEKWLRKIWPDEFVDQVMPRFQHTLETGEPFSSQETVEQRRDYDGTEAYHWTLRRVGLPDGQNGVVCHFYALNKLREAELSARQSEGRLRMAMELANMGVITVDYKSETARLEAAAAEIFNLPADTDISQSALHNQFHPDDRQWVLDNVEQTRRDPTSKTIRMQHRVRWSDGTLRWVDVCKRMTFREGSNDTGEALSCTVTVVDITEQKAHESKLETARLTAEQAKEQAENAKRQAEAANRARGEFLANMSHEIRTPMTAILGYADMLGDHLADPDNQQCVQTIRRNGRFLLDIINDILDLSKIDAGRLQLQPEPVQPARMLADIVSLMNVRAEEQQIRLNATFDGKIPEQIQVDVKRLKQILLNLTGNAIKFTEDGEVRIVCRYEMPSDSGRGHLVFDVIDTGIGISEDRLEDLFEPFVQMDQSNTRSFGGTGLGLAISRRLAQLLGGDITAESQPGKGSRFSLRLDPGPIDDIPLVKPSLVVSPTQSPPDAKEFNGHCLIVDDRRDIRFLAQHLIEQAGGTVTTASDGKEGVQTLQRLLDEGSPIDVVLMDMQMPVMDGYEAVAEIRRRGIQIPVIALTANAMAEDRNKCLDAGCTDFLSKPLDRSSLFEKLVRLTGATD